MRVVTLDESMLDEHAARLAAAVANHFPRVNYDAIIGVKRGGALVCDVFCRHFPKSDYGFRADVFLQRPTTKKKSGLVRTMLRTLPYWLLDNIRIAESRILEWKNRKKNRKSVQESVNDVDLPENLYLMLRAKEAPKVLIIDDAIDSGHTLSAIVNALRDKNPDTEIKVAVLTETTASPRIRADFTIYHNRTLIRFPWSNDYKQKKAQPS